MRVSLSAVVATFLFALSACGSSGPAPNPQACTAANEHLTQCNGPSPLFDPNACDSQTTCKADCINQGSCADVLAFVGGDDTNSVGVCVSGCGQ